LQNLRKAIFDDKSSLAFATVFESTKVALSCHWLFYAPKHYYVYSVATTTKHEVYALAISVGVVSGKRELGGLAAKPLITDNILP